MDGLDIKKRVLHAISHHDGGTVFKETASLSGVQRWIHDEDLTFLHLLMTCCEIAQTLVLLRTLTDVAERIVRWHLAEIY